MINTRQVLPMIGVTLVEDFVKNPPPYFQVQHCVRHPVIRPIPEQVNLCAHDKSHEAWFPDSMGRVLKVSTVAQYDQLVERLLSRPLVFDVKLERRHKSGRIRYILKCDIIVTVNTSHPVIKNQMQQIFSGGREDIVNERNFALEFNFNSILKSWFSTVHQGQDGIFDTTYDCTYADFVVTNSTEFNSMYSCSPEGVCLFLMCLPCCIFMCPAYRIARCLTTVDRDTDVRGDVSYLTFKREQRSAQDELLDMFRQYLVQQMMEQGSRQNREQPYLGVADVTRQPGGRGGAAIPRPGPPPPPGSGFQQHPAEMFHPYAPPQVHESGHVERPVAPYGYGQTLPPPGGPMPVNPMGPTPLPPGPAGVAIAPPTMAHPQAPPSYSQPLGAPAPAQPELPSYDYVMAQNTDQDQLIT
ncbi:uncharacterized protein LOC121426349 [Lytechinus variegatus]|uniref:uncharacterized protein LOC121426349 n=1 Tax=Lytechinus variegatus TaxID=7654 RepID=UPI001BB126FE|nr:uncharacterized protein LOC121426349 [Lytechinus variegatus]XP_041478558.1 uncharacterized protein LOC121426349 [Lytechinus variegatus]